MAIRERVLPSNDTTAARHLPRFTWETVREAPIAVEVDGRLFIHAAAELGYPVFPQGDSDVIFVFPGEKREAQMHINQKAYEIAGRGKREPTPVYHYPSPEEVADSAGRVYLELSASLKRTR